MEDDDKTYMWLTIITFLAFVVGILFVTMELMEYKDENHRIEENIFRN